MSLIGVLLLGDGRVVECEFGCHFEDGGLESYERVNFTLSWALELDWWHGGHSRREMEVLEGAFRALGDKFVKLGWMGYSVFNVTVNESCFGDPKIKRVVLPQAEFAYNRSSHSSTGRSPFLVVYGRNPFTPLDLAPLPAVDSYSVEGEAQATQIKALHEQVRDQITKHNLQYQARANKHRKHVVFNEGDLVWIYLRKDRFPPGRYGKLQDRADGPFRVLKRINDNAYKIDLPGSYGVSATFNVADLTPYVEADDFHGDSGTSRFLEGEDDTDGPDGSSPVDQRAVDENEAGGLSG
ncbi:RNA-directed DNA polymerase [Tanacetum coccineum]